MRFIVLGGGCYGTFYTRQLVRAHEAGAIAKPEIVVVDHNAAPRVVQENGGDSGVRIVRQDWEQFFEEYLADLPPDTDDQIVPPPFTPHLAVSWLLAALRRDRPEMDWQVEPFRAVPQTPFVRQTDAGTVTASHADWICPVHCVEPGICPKTRGPRFWDMAETASDLRHALALEGQPIDQLHLLQCLHFSHGVGTYPAAALLKAFTKMRSSRARPDQPIRALVGTVSRCHGAMHLLKGQPATDTRVK